MDIREKTSQKSIKHKKCGHSPLNFYRAYQIDAREDMRKPVDVVFEKGTLTPHSQSMAFSMSWALKVKTKVTQNGRKE